MLAVTDSGTGMSREVLERAFEPFFTTKPTGMGTGLGLSMVYGFVKQSDGHIKIYSEPAKARRSSSTSRASPSSAACRTGPTSAHPRGRRRAPAAARRSCWSRTTRRSQVRDRGAARARLHASTPHPTARARCACSKPNPNIALLFTDVVLPGGMNGRQLADEARRRRPDLKVLYATGYTRNAIIHQGRLDAEVELLTKPFTADALARKVRQILERPAERRSVQHAGLNGCHKSSGRGEFHHFVRQSSSKFVTFGTNPACMCFAAGSRKETSMSAVAVRAMFRSHPEKPAHSDAMSRCIDACFNCVETCTACADACLSERDVVASGRLHPAQSRLRRGVQRHRQHHGALQQGRAPPASRGATGELHRVLPRLRRRMQRATARCTGIARSAPRPARPAPKPATLMLSTMRMPA